MKFPKNSLFDVHACIDAPEKNRMMADPITQRVMTPNAARILVATDKVADGNEIHGLLNGRFGQIRLSTDPNGLVREFGDFNPDLLVLAFDTLEKAQMNHRRLNLPASSRHLHRVITLCNRQELHEAFELCCRHGFDDYVLYWPHAQDSSRLEMSLRSAYRGLSDLREQMAICAASAEPAAPPAGRDQRPIVMVVEDEEMARTLLSLTLDPADYAIVFASDAHSALSQLQQQRPDVILMDIRLPGVDGMAFTEQLKASVESADIPIIMVTGDARHATLRSCIRAGAVDFIVKPFTRALLTGKLQKVLRQSEFGAAAAH